MAIRLSTLAEIKVLSLSGILTGRGLNNGNPLNAANADDVRAALETMRTSVTDPATLQVQKSNVSGDGIFKTVGIARSVRLDEDYGTQNYYGIGAPTRPRIVPNNYSVSASIQRIQLDTRDLNHYITRPEYWYSDEVQRQVGIDDVMLYTFLFLKSKEAPTVRQDIYALMPRSSSRAVASSDVMIANDVNMVGFKYSYEELFFDLSNLINETITDRVAGV